MRAKKNADSLYMPDALSLHQHKSCQLTLFHTERSTAAGKAMFCRVHDCLIEEEASICKLHSRPVHLPRGQGI